jgi:hypothetical protein
MLAFAGQAERMRIDKDLARLMLVRLLLEGFLLAGLAIGFTARPDAVPRGVGGLLDGFFAPLNLGGEVGVVRGLGDGRGVFGRLNQARILLGAD